MKTEQEQTEKRPEGRPPLFKTPEELESKVDEYFETGCRVREVIVGPANRREKALLKVPTITGLTLFLGFSNRQSFYDYEKRPEFSDSIKSARTRIEMEYEEQLACGAPTGAIFALKQFGWKDSPLIDQSVNNHYVFFSEIIKKSRELCPSFPSR